MAKSRAYSSSQRSKAEPGRKSVQTAAYRDRNLAGMSPEKAQEALKPSDAEAVPMHKRMAGCS